MDELGSGWTRRQHPMHARLTTKTSNHHSKLTRNSTSTPKQLRYGVAMQTKPSSATCNGQENYFRTAMGWRRCDGCLLEMTKSDARPRPTTDREHVPARAERRVRVADVPRQPGDVRIQALRLAVHVVHLRPHPRGCCSLRHWIASILHISDARCNLAAPERALRDRPMGSGSVVGWGFSRCPTRRTWRPAAGGGAAGTWARDPSS